MLHVLIWGINLFSLCMFVFRPLQELRRLRTRPITPQELWSIPVEIVAVTMMATAFVLRAVYGLHSASFYLQAFGVLVFAAGCTPGMLLSLRKVFAHHHMQEERL